MPTRRAVLRGLGTAGAVALGAGVASADHPETKPDSVTVSYNQSKLDQYRPELVFEAATREKLLGLYGAWVSSTERDTDVAVYWASYSHQEGVSPFSGPLGDSHRGDHEPFYVFTDSESGDVVEVVASIYHWIAGRASAADVPMTNGHPRAKVVAPWHQYTAPPPDTSGVLLDVDDLTSVFDAWRQNGLEDALAPGAGLYNPWLMRSRESWWRRSSTYGFSLTEQVLLGLAGAGFGTIGSLSR